MKRSLKTFTKWVKAGEVKSDILSAILGSADKKASFQEKLEWFERLLRAIRAKPKLINRFDKETGQLHWVRIKFTLTLLEKNPEWKSNVAHCLRTILEQTSGVDLFTRTGLSHQGGLFSELADRTLMKFLPAAPRHQHLDDIFNRIFRSERDILWVENLPSEVLEKIVELLCYEQPGFEFYSLKRASSDALVILAEHVASRGLTSEIRNRLPFSSVPQSPFLALRVSVDHSVNINDANKNGQSLFHAVHECFQAIEMVYQSIDSTGVSIPLVFHLELMKASLRRIELLARVLNISDSAPTRESRLQAVKTLWGALITDSLSAKKFRTVLQDNLRLLSQKIVERAAETGDHYSVKNRSEYGKMLRAGLGGGAITVVTTLIKFAVSFAKLPLFFEGLFIGLNYSLSFTAMQLVGFTLATKQPAMTGPALADKMKKLRNSEDRRKFVDEVAGITRSQFVAALGNVGAVFPLCFLLDVVIRYTTGHWYLSLEKANYVVHSTNPISTLTIFYAAWTGIILWSGGIAAGWAENWVVYRRLPEAIEAHPRLQSFLGRERAKKFSKAFMHNVGGIVGSFALGFQMAFTPILGRFFGFPLEVRHVTLASGSLGFAIGPLYESAAPFPWTALILAVVGIGAVFVFNLGVSFSLAFLVAVRARGISRRSIKLLLRRTANQFSQHPFSFLIPPRTRVETALPPPAK